MGGPRRQGKGPGIFVRVGGSVKCGRMVRADKVRVWVFVRVGGSVRCGRMVCADKVRI